MIIRDDDYRTSAKRLRRLLLAWRNFKALGCEFLTYGVGCGRHETPAPQQGYVRRIVEGTPNKKTMLVRVYRRAMLGEQTFEGREQNLSQANKVQQATLEWLHRRRSELAIARRDDRCRARGQAVHRRRS